MLYMVTVNELTLIISWQKVHVTKSLQPREYNSKELCIQLYKPK